MRRDLRRRHLPTLRSTCSELLGDHATSRCTLDLNMRTTEALSLKTQREMVKTVHAAVIAYRPHQENEVLVCTRGYVRSDLWGCADRVRAASKFRPESELLRDYEAYLAQWKKRVPNNKYREFSITLRLYWDFGTTPYQARQLQESILYALDHSWQVPFARGDTWSTVVDIGPLITGNSPMVGSCLPLPCVLCRPSGAVSPQHCPGCQGAGFVLETKRLEPVFLLIGSNRKPYKRCWRSRQPWCGAVRFASRLATKPQPKTPSSMAILRSLRENRGCLP